MSRAATVAFVEPSTLSDATGACIRVEHRQQEIWKTLTAWAGNDGDGDGETVGCARVVVVFAAPAHHVSLPTQRN